ncbi:MAG: lipid-A-disaccharide synthase [Lishizhenia sp.]
MKIYCITGEASGDLHGSNFLKELYKKEPTTQVRFWGGDEMQKIAGEPVKHIKDLAFMGFLEVLMNIKTILRNITFCKKDILDFQPDAIVLIDYPGFNLRIAEWAKEQGIRVVYYVSPQIWAWKQNRVHKIKKVVDKMFVILPFEKEFYKKFNVDVEYVGHPLIDAIQNFRNTKPSLEVFDTKKKIIAVLPGSRKQEIKKKLPVMLEAIKSFDDYTFVIAGAPSLEPKFYDQFLVHENIKIVFGRTYDLLNIATAALVTSGTATLETALFKVPEVVCYKSSSVSYQIAKRLVKIKYISLVNLILDKECVKELIQNDCNPKKVKEELAYILPNGKKRSSILKDYEVLEQKLGGGGASEYVAQSLIDFLK